MTDGNENDQANSGRNPEPVAPEPNQTPDSAPWESQTPQAPEVPTWQPPVAPEPAPSWQPAPPTPPAPDATRWQPPTPPIPPAAPAWQPVPPPQTWQPQPPAQSWPPASPATPPTPPTAALSPWAPQQPQQSTPTSPWSPTGWSPAGQTPPPAQPPYQPPYQQPYGAPYQTPGYGQGDWPSSMGSAPRRASRAPMFLAFLAVAILAFAGGMVTDRLVIGEGGSSTNTGSNSGSSIGATNSAELKNFGLYNEALSIIREKFVGRSTLTDQQLLYGSIKGLVDSLGDTGHTTFLTPDEYKQFQSQLSATFAGIGVELADQTPPYTIGRVLPGTPAEKAGLKAGDTITAVDGVNAAGLLYSDFVDKIRGPAGTTVTLSILHSGSATPVDIKVTRATLNIPLVEWGMVPGTHIADIVLAEFSQGAYDQLSAAVTSATSAGATSIVFDIRGNPGGYASEALNVASEFLSSGVVYIQRDANGNQNPIDVAANETPTKLPMVVLVDHDSASAAEIVAGALQDNGRAKIVGLTTFGTGTVLTPETLSDGSVILLGTSDWLTPHGHRIFGVGITPDQQVAMPTGSQPTDPTTLSTMTATAFASSADAELLAAVKDLTK